MKEKLVIAPYIMKVVLQQSHNTSWKLKFVMQTNRARQREIDVEIQETILVIGAVNSSLSMGNITSFNVCLKIFFTGKG